ncbi:MAG: hypothetical protein ACOVRM_11235, partial [Planctomycetaceae bacterium]
MVGRSPRSGNRAGDKSRFQEQPYEAATNEFGDAGGGGHETVLGLANRRDRQRTSFAGESQV